MIHRDYEKLTEAEKTFVDEIFVFAFQKWHGLKQGGRVSSEAVLDNCDGVEIAVEAIATWVLKSRPALHAAE